MKRRWVMALAMGGLGCAEAMRSGSEGEDNSLRAWQPIEAAAPAVKRPLGEDCTVAGRAECADGVCMHVQPDVNKGYVCSKTCQVDDDCPENWGCRPVVPGESTAYCLPPAGWTAKVANRGARRVAARPVLQPDVLPPAPRDGGGQ